MDEPAPYSFAPNRHLGVSYVDLRSIVQDKSGVRSSATDEGDEFVVLAGSQALKDAGYAQNSYARLKQELINNGTLRLSDDGKFYEFAKPYFFRSPSAAAAVILDRNTNGQSAWHLLNSDRTYHQWQEDQGMGKSS